MRPGLIHIDPADMHFINRMNQRYENIYGRMLAIHHAKAQANEDLALDGYAILYDQPLAYDGEIWVFEAGCFSESLRAAKEIHFQLDHDKNQRIASTHNALSFADDETGLAFRLGLDDIKQGGELKRMVDTGRRAAISVGIRNDQSYIKIFGKHQVRMITKAELFEISLVGAGKHPNAFAGVVSADVESLEPGKKGSMFTINFTAHKLKRMNQTVAERSEALRAIASKLDRIDGKTGPVVGKTESNIDKWYREWNSRLDADSPNLARWYKNLERRCVRDRMRSHR